MGMDERHRGWAWHVVALPLLLHLSLSPFPTLHLAPFAPCIPLVLSLTLTFPLSPLPHPSPFLPSPECPLPVPLKATIIAACLALHLVSMRKFPPLPLFAFVISKPCNSSFARGCRKCPFFNIFLWLMFVIL